VLGESRKVRARHTPDDRISKSSMPYFTSLDDHSAHARVITLHDRNSFTKKRYRP
jgi:hypothetical protein